MHRHWLIKNKIDFQEFLEEKEYCALQKQVDFENRIIKPSLIKDIKGPIRFKNIDNTCYMIGVT